MAVRRLPLVLLLATACTAKPDTKQDAKQDVKPDSKPEEPQPTTAANELPPETPTVALVPGESIGPARIGMSKAEIEALGFKTHPQFSAMTIPITAYYDQADKARAVEISLMHTDKDVSVGDVTIPKTATLEQIRELLGDCKEAEIATGASNYPCRGGALLVAIGSGNPDEIWLRVTKPD